jgi:hypothetical protein
MKRKHISWKTKCAAAVLDAFAQRERFGLYPGRWYDDAKKMTEDQFLSLFQWDHNILHSSEDESRDRFWNLAPMLIDAHRKKTKADAKVVAKSKRIRASWVPEMLAESEKDYKRYHKLRSRGFDKTRRRKMDGTVVKRKG